MFKIIDIIFGSMITILIVCSIVCIYLKLEEPIKKKYKKNKEIKQLKQWSSTKKRNCYNELIKINDRYKKTHSKNKQEAINAIIAGMSQSIGGEIIESDECRIKREYGIEVNEKNIYFYISTLRELM